MPTTEGEALSELDRLVREAQRELAAEQLKQEASEAASLQREKENRALCRDAVRIFRQQNVPSLEAYTLESRNTWRGQKYTKVPQGRAWMLIGCTCAYEGNALDARYLFEDGRVFEGHDQKCNDAPYGGICLGKEAEYFYGFYGRKEWLAKIVAIRQKYPH